MIIITVTKTGFLMLTLFFSMVLGLVCLDFHNKVLYYGWLKPEEFIFPQFWRLEVQDEGISRVGGFWEYSPWLVESHLFPMLHRSSLCLHFLSNYWSYQISTHPKWLYLTLVTSLKKKKRKRKNKNVQTLWKKFSSF